MLPLGFLAFVRLAFPEGPRTRSKIGPNGRSHYKNCLLRRRVPTSMLNKYRVYRAEHFTKDYYWWRINASPQLIALMVREWKLRPGTQDHVDRFWQHWPSDWEPVNSQGGKKCLENSVKPSDNFVVIVDESRPVGYVSYWFIF